MVPTHPREQLLPTIQESFGDEQCLFQHDGTHCHKAKVITKLLGEQNIDIVGPWPGNSPDLIPIENLWPILKRWAANNINVLFPEPLKLSFLPYGKVLHHSGKGIVRHQTVPG